MIHLLMQPVHRHCHGGNWHGSRDPANAETPLFAKHLHAFCRLSLKSCSVQHGAAAAVDGDIVPPAEVMQSSMQSAARQEPV